MPRGRVRGDLASRFWPKVDVRSADQCWPWLGCRGPTGYGQLSRDEDGDQRAHRVAYKLGVGAIPAGLVVMHKCDNPACCNPAHLALGTQAENVTDAVLKKRHNSQRRPPRSKLWPDDVRAIRAGAAAGRTRRELSGEFGVSPDTVWAVVTRRAWSHVA